MTKLTEQLLFAAPHGFFTSADIVQYVPGTDNARYSLVKRAVAAGEIIRVRRGLYCLAPEFRRAPLNLYALAQHVYGPSYISLESALAYHGWIPEAVYTITSTCTAESKTFTTPVGVFSFTRVPQNVFYAGVAREADASSGATALVARPVKALADYVYTYHKDWRTTRPAVASLRIDEADLASVSRDDLEEIVDNYRSTRVRRFLSALHPEQAA